MLLRRLQRSSDKHEIIFFEPNGLRHYEFPLPKDRVCDQVAGMGWNVDGSLLCVLYGGGEQDRRAAQLWHRSD
jgi:elongator complex protein 1